MRWIFYQIIIAPDKFPTTLEELNQYEAVILSDIGSNTCVIYLNQFLHMEKSCLID